MAINSQKAKVPGWDALPEEPGVYLLFVGTECVYVGSSFQLRSRVRNHTKSADCTSVGYALCAFGEMSSLEQRLIDYLRPLRNRSRGYRGPLVGKAAYEHAQAWKREKAERRSRKGRAA